MATITASHISALVRSYAADTRERMTRIIDCVSVEGGGDEVVQDVLVPLREQEQASHVAGFENIAILCRKMEGCLIRPGSDQQSKCAVTALAQFCEFIRLHSDAVAQGLIFADGASEEQLSRRSSANEDRQEPSGNSPSLNLSKKSVPAPHGHHASAGRTQKQTS